MSESPATFPIVGVGASVGGVEAFGELLREVPAGTGLAFVFIQHPDSTHPGDPSATLARTTSFPVLEIQEGMRVEPEHVYVVPGDAGVVSGLLDHPRLRSALEGVRHRNESFLGVELDCELPRLGKRCLSLSARFVPMPDTGRLILLAIEDVTARRRGEAERAQLLRETQAAKASAEEANRAKDIFLATLSHELRTPLSTLLLSAELLRTGQLSEDKVRRTVDASRERPKRRRSSSTIFSTSRASSPAS